MAPSRTYTPPPFSTIETSTSKPVLDLANDSAKIHHRSLMLTLWDEQLRLQQGNGAVVLDGNSLRIPSVVSVARQGAHVTFQDTAVRNRMVQSVSCLHEQLDALHSIYGITTGFGGSADTRTRDYAGLQRALLQHQQCAILPSVSSTRDNQGDLSSKTTRKSTSFESMPEDWVRGAMLVRCNSVVRGHSGVRPELVDMLVKMINHNVIPIVPLRGSISASGDLCPLSYIAGVLEGNPDIYVSIDGDHGRESVPSNAALSRLNLRPIVFGPKEGLGLMNGTAVSTAVAAIALNESQQMAVLAQVLTAMGTEALLGTAESFDSFIAKIRPHDGQMEVAHNITSFLSGSRIARRSQSMKTIEGNDHDLSQLQQELRQDRYAIRTASQWIGPLLEDLMLAHKQVSVECNSTTDNPLIDIDSYTCHHGGNFQAMSITSAMEKTRTALQLLGRMLFAQCTELVNPALNNGLPPSLAADEPSLSYTMKGVDINVASYASELGFLAHPVGPNVQTAEMANQSLNSLALISARYTGTAADILTMMSASYLYTLCQALDLRAMHIHFVSCLDATLSSTITSVLSHIPNLNPASFVDSLRRHILHVMTSTTTMDTIPRFHHIAQSTQSFFITFLSSLPTPSSETETPDFLPLLTLWPTRLAADLATLFSTTRTTYFAHPDATPYLGAASKRMYTFVRNELQVPFHRGLIDHPTPIRHNPDGKGPSPTEQPIPAETASGDRKVTIGTHITAIYATMKDGRLYVPVMECLRGVEEGENDGKGGDQ
ncbi:MAG: hypothetical protein M1833_005520 [Piccolia ochrophora]|nr:MAG: hypothetical protein M1833_005520 [Piccolia ochrophora]